MSNESLQDLLQQKNERIENLEDKNKILFNQLYKAKQELHRLKSNIKERFDDPEHILETADNE